MGNWKCRHCRTDPNTILNTPWNKVCHLSKLGDWDLGYCFVLFIIIIIIIGHWTWFKCLYTMCTNSTFYPTPIVPPSPFSSQKVIELYFTFCGTTRQEEERDGQGETSYCFLIFELIEQQDIKPVSSSGIKHSLTPQSVINSLWIVGNCTNNVQQRSHGP